MIWCRATPCVIPIKDSRVSKIILNQMTNQSNNFLVWICCQYLWRNIIRGENIALYFYNDGINFFFIYFESDLATSTCFCYFPTDWLPRRRIIFFLFLFCSERHWIKNSYLTKFDIKPANVPGKSSMNFINHCGYNTDKR